MQCLVSPHRQRASGICRSCVMRVFSESRRKAVHFSQVQMTETHCGSERDTDRENGIKIERHRQKHQPICCSIEFVGDGKCKINMNDFHNDRARMIEAGFTSFLFVSHYMLRSKRQSMAAFGFDNHMTGGGKARNCDLLLA